MTTVSEYAALSALVYNDQRGGGIGSPINKLPVPSGWQTLTDLGFAVGDTLNAINPFSFTGGAYLNQATGEIVVAYKGTDFLVEFSGRAWNTVADLLTDVGLATSKALILGLGQQLNAMAYYLAVKDWAVDNGYDLSKISFTGHSLGGGLAANMAVWFDRPATTFASAPFEVNTLNPIAISAAFVAITSQFAGTALAGLFDGTGFEGSVAVVDSSNDLRRLLFNEIVAGNLYENEVDQTEFDRRELAVTNVYNEGEFLWYGRELIPTVVGADIAIDLDDGSHPLEHAMGLHSMNLHAAFLFEDRLRQMVKQIPELLDALLNKNLYAADENTATQDFVTRLVNDQIQQGFGQPSALTRFTDDIDKLKSAEGTVAQEDMRTALIALAMDFHHHAQEGSTENLFRLESGAIHFDLNHINSDFLKGLPLLRDAASSTAIGGDPFVSGDLRYATQWHIQTGAGAMNWQASELANDVAIGEAQDDVLRSGGGADFLIGGEGADLFEGGSGNDTLLGGAGIDQLHGEAGDDLLHGGAGADVYFIDGSVGNDTIIDPDGGLIKYQGHDLTGGEETSPGAQEWKDEHATYRIITEGTQGHLLISVGAGTVTIRDWTPGHFGIQLQDFEAPTPVAPQTTFVGDLAPVDQNSQAEGVQLAYDQLGNVIVHAGQAEPNRADTLYDSTGHDEMRGLGGDDLLDAIRGGNDTLIGGEGRDRLLGHAGEDRFFAEDEQSDAQVLADHATATEDVNSIAEQGDLLSGGADEDWQVGGRRADLLYGGDGKDTLWGGAGNDVIYGDTQAESAQSDWTFERTTSFNPATSVTTYTVTTVNIELAAPGGHADVLHGGAGNDWILGEGGQDQLHGGSGDDVLFGGGDSDWLVGGASADVLYGDDGVSTGADYGHDLLEGGAGNDSLHGDAGHDVLFGGDGDDELIGDGSYIDIAAQGDDFLDGGAGHDTLYGYAGNDTLMGSTGDDLLLGDAGQDDLAGQHHGGDLLDSGAGNDSLYGFGGSDTLLGGEGNDVLNGDAPEANLASAHHGDDLLDGGIGNDTLFGAGGTDTLLGGEGDDYLDGDADAANVAGEFHGNDSLDGGAGNDTLMGGGGSDALIGGSGNDDLQGDRSSGLELAHHGNDLLDGGEGDDTLRGDGGNDTLIGGGGGDSLYGGAGDDLLDGGADDDLLIGGAGDDTILYQDGMDIIRFAIGDGHDTILMQGYYPADGTHKTIEFAAGILPGDVFLTATYGDLMLSLSGGADSISIQGIVYDELKVAVAFANGTVWSPQDLALAARTVAGDDQANALTGTSQSDRLLGLAGNDTLLGYDGEDTLDGGEGADSMEGGWGDDTYHVDHSSDLVVEQSDQGHDRVFSSVTHTLRANVEDLELTGTANLNGTGNALANRIVGNAGNNSLSGAAGADTLEGGIGNDIYVVDNAADVMVEVEDQGTDLVQSSVSHTLSANVENLTLTGSSSISGTGNSQANHIVGNSGANSLAGGLGDDTLDGGAGADSMLGGAGNDRYVVERTSDVVVELADEGTDTVSSSVTWTLGNHLENLVLTGSSGIHATGNALDNHLTGNSGNNSLVGNAGNDTLDGGTGNDSMIGGLGNDTYLVDSASDQVVEAASGGVDTVQSSVTYTLGTNVEKLILTGSIAINGTGNTLDNVLTGNSGKNVLTGGAGNDTYVVGTGDTTVEAASAGTDTVQSAITWTLATNVENLTLTGASAINGTGNTLNNVLTGNSAANTLSGGAGVDTMMGGLGNDTYVTDNTGDVVVELANEGTDLVNSSVTYTLSSQVENLALTGSGAINGTGNALDNVLTGNSGKNVLTGGAGNDTYVVGAGDTTVEAASAGTDSVQSAITWTLATNVENLTLTGTSAINGTGNTLDNVLIGNGSVNVLTGGAGDDTLNGAAGADSLVGGAGNDTYWLGRGFGVDTITENDATAGNTDVARFEAGIAVDQLWFAKSGNNLNVSIIGTNDQFTLTNWYLGNQYHVEQFETASGRLLLDDQVENLVNVMAGFSKPVLGQTNLPESYAVSLVGVIDTVWL